MITAADIGPTSGVRVRPSLVGGLDRRPAVLLALLGALVALIYSINLNNSPDFSQDEVVYTSLGQHIADLNTISVERGPFLVHPPLYFLIASVWQRITGVNDSATLDALHATRYLSVIFCVIAAVAIGWIARRLLAGATPGLRTLGTVTAVLLFALNAFTLAFGRVVLLEPAALAAGALIVLTSLLLRERSVATQVIVIGLLIGLGCLIKQTVVFAGFVPLLAALLERDGRRIRVGLGAVVIGALTWSMFPIWAAATGHGSYFWSQQTVSIRRLAGLLQTSGVNVASASPTDQLRRTFWLYSAGYAQVAVAAILLVALVVRSGLITPRRWRAGPEDAVLIAYGVLAFAFVLYSFAFGQGNQQFTSYLAPAAALVSAVALARALGAGSAERHRRRSRRVGPGGALAVTVALALVVGGGVTWMHYYAAGDDRATAQVAAYVRANVPRCVPINASGSQVRWQAALTQDDVTSYRDGNTALAKGVRLFLLSPKDARYAYGNMSDGLAAWIRSHGTLTFQARGRSSESIQLWTVAGSAATGAKSPCVSVADPPSRNASAGWFAALIGGYLLAMVVIGLILAAATRRRRSPVEDEYSA